MQNSVRDVIDMDTEAAAMITTRPSTMMIRVFVGNFFGPVYPIAIPHVLKSGFKAFSIVPCETHHMAVIGLTQWDVIVLLKV